MVWGGEYRTRSKESGGCGFKQKVLRREILCFMTPRWRRETYLTVWRGRLIESCSCGICANGVEEVAIAFMLHQAEENDSFDGLERE
jgi:hypothetical protein